MSQIGGFQRISSSWSGTNKKELELEVYSVFVAENHCYNKYINDTTMAV